MQYAAAARVAKRIARRHSTYRPSKMLFVFRFALTLQNHNLFDSVAYCAVVLVAAWRRATRRSRKINKKIVVL